jgi:hypothetical protein
MGLHTSDIDSVREDEIGQTIRDLKEKIAHLKTYTLQDTGLLELHLEMLIEQHKQETDNGNT